MCNIHIGQEISKGPWGWSFQWREDRTQQYKGLKRINGIIRVKMGWGMKRPSRGRIIEGINNTKDL